MNSSSIPRRRRNIGKIVKDRSLHTLILLSVEAIISVEATISVEAIIFVETAISVEATISVEDLECSEFR